MQNKSRERILRSPFVTVRLEFNLAFDLAFSRLAELAGPSDPLIVLASTPSFVEGAQLRWPGPLAFPDVAADRAPRPLPGRGLWASPERATWLARLTLLADALAERAVLAILTAGLLAPLPLPLRTPPAPGEPRSPIPGLRAGLEGHGFAIERGYPIGGLASMLWATLRVLALRRGRPDLADRCEAAYRLALARPVPRRLASYHLLIAAREGRA